MQTEHIRDINSLIQMERISQHHFNECAIFIQGLSYLQYCSRPLASPGIFQAEMPATNTILSNQAFCSLTHFYDVPTNVL